MSYNLCPFCCEDRHHCGFSQPASETSYFAMSGEQGNLKKIKRLYFKLANCIAHLWPHSKVSGRERRTERAGSLSFAFLEVQVLGLGFHSSLSAGEFKSVGRQRTNGPNSQLLKSTKIFKTKEPQGTCWRYVNVSYPSLKWMI